MSVESLTKEYSDIVDDLRRVYASQHTKSYEWRASQLAALTRLINECEDELCEALAMDLGKPRLEAEMTEVVVTGIEARDAKSHLKKWMKDEEVNTPGALLPGKSYIHYEPFGVCLIIAPFNYPIQLALGPLVGAIAAGNCVVLKPSEQTPNVSAALARLIPQYLDNECFRVIEGAIPETTALLNQHWDLIFFTGSPGVAKIVAARAAEHLTPVILELGGQSPVIIDKDVGNLQVAANRIWWGKTMNAGQTCVSPDYVLCHESKFDEFLDLIQSSNKNFFPEGAAKSPDFGKICSERHLGRLQELINEMPEDKILFGGDINMNALHMSPTVVIDPDENSRLWNEETFGPILVVKKYSTTQEAIHIINSKEHPLALYLFTRNDKTIKKFLQECPSGGFSVNETLMHCASPFLPFGGVGNSGTGNYHGKSSFLAFSHLRSCLVRDDHGIFDAPVRYPPFTNSKKKQFRWLAENLPNFPPLKTIGKWFGMTVALGAIAYGLYNGYS